MSQEGNTGSNRIAQSIACGVGFLFGGLCGLMCGQYFQNELTVVFLYAIGAIAGAVLGVRAMENFRARSKTDSHDDL